MVPARPKGRGLTKPLVKGGPQLTALRAFSSRKREPYVFPAFVASVTTAQSFSDQLSACATDRISNVPCAKGAEDRAFARNVWLGRIARSLIFCRAIATADLLHRGHSGPWPIALKLGHARVLQSGNGGQPASSASLRRFWRIWTARRNHAY